MAAIEKYKNEIEKTKTKIGELQKKVRDLEQKIAEEENLEIVRMVKAVKLNRESLCQRGNLPAGGSGRTGNGGQRL